MLRRAERPGRRTGECQCASFRRREFDLAVVAEMQFKLKAEPPALPDAPGRPGHDAFLVAVAHAAVDSLQRQRAVAGNEISDAKQLRSRRQIDRMPRRRRAIAAIVNGGHPAGWSVGAAILGVFIFLDANAGRQALVTILAFEMDCCGQRIRKDPRPAAMLAGPERTILIAIKDAGRTVVVVLDLARGHRIADADRGARCRDRAPALVAVRSRGCR